MTDQIAGQLANRTARTSKAVCTQSNPANVTLKARSNSTWAVVSFSVFTQPASKYELCGGQGRVDKQRGTNVQPCIDAHPCSDEFDELAAIVIADQCRFAQ